VRRWECTDCDGDAETLRQRGRCGGPIASDLPGAQRDHDGRWYVLAEEACGYASAMPGDLRCYRCPVAMAADVGRSGLAQVYHAAHGGLPLSALGLTTISEGARQAVEHIEAAWDWRRGVERRRDDAARKARRP
jgi:hypothetical protein